MIDIKRLLQSICGVTTSVLNRCFARFIIETHLVAVKYVDYIFILIFVSIIVFVIFIK